MLGVHFYGEMYLTKRNYANVDCEEKIDVLPLEMLIHNNGPIAIGTVKRTMEKFTYGSICAGHKEIIPALIIFFDWSDQVSLITLPARTLHRDGH
jgi:hypothetical protein